MSNTTLMISGRDDRRFELASGRPVIMLGSNDYLGLAAEPRVIRGAVEALQRYGTGLAINQPFATTALHQELRERIAAFCGMEAALLFGSCTAANIALLSTMARETGATIFCDDNNHPSIRDGCRLSHGRTVFYHTRKASDLEAKIAAETASGARVIISDGVFSIEGDLAPTPMLSRIARIGGAMLVLDESHAAGVVGARGRGSAEVFAMRAGRDIAAVTGTFAKAFGAGSGGYVAGPTDLLAEVARTARFYIYNTGMNVAAAGAALVGVELAERDSDRRARLVENAAFLRAELNAAGLRLCGGDTPITPVVIGDEAKTRQLGQRLRERGVIVTVLAFPIVPRGESLLRLQPSALHSREELRRACEMMAELALDLELVD
jgi:glycine C-acetyltransferase